MKRKRIIGLLIVGMFVVIVMSLGCIEKETTIPLPTEELEALRGLIKFSERAPDLWYVAVRGVYDDDATPVFIAFNLTTKEEAYYYLNMEKEFWSEENFEFFGRKGFIWYILKNGKVIDWGTHGEITAGIMPAPTPTPKPISTLIEEGYEQYLDDEFQFSIYYPGNWRIIPFKNIPYLEITGNPEYVVEVVNFCDPDTTELDIPEDINKFLGRWSCGYFIQVSARNISCLEGDFTGKFQVGNYTIVERYADFPTDDKCYGVKCSGFEGLFEKNKDICDAVVDSFTILGIAPEEVWECKEEFANVSNVVISDSRAFLKEDSCQYVCDITNYSQGHK